MPGTKKPTVRTFRKMKRDGAKIVMTTAWDAPMAKFAADAGIDLLLVGDSLGMSALGYKDTIPVTMDDMIHHCKAVRRGAPEMFIVGDMPFLSYHKSMDQALTNAGRFLQEAHCDAVKLESDRTVIPAVRRLVETGIPVMAHIGLLPQSLKTSGSYRIAGRSEEAAEALIEDAKALQDAGAFCIVLECLPKHLAKRIAETLEIPAIGIGAGPFCDGQVQVCCDTLGFFDDFLPKHAKRYAEFGPAAVAAFRAYAEDVRKGVFPAEENSFD